MHHLRLSVLAQKLIVTYALMFSSCEWFAQSITATAPHRLTALTALKWNDLHRTLPVASRCS